VTLSALYDHVLCYYNFTGRDQTVESWASIYLYLMVQSLHKKDLGYACNLHMDDVSIIKVSY